MSDISIVNETSPEANWNRQGGRTGPPIESGWHSDLKLRQPHNKPLRGRQPESYVQAIGLYSSLQNQLSWVWMGPLQTSAAYLRFHLGRLVKLQGKVMTQNLEWWVILMVDCVTNFWLCCPPIRLQNIQLVSITRLITMRSQPNYFIVVVVVDIVIRIKHIHAGLYSQKRVTQ